MSQKDISQLPNAIAKRDFLFGVKKAATEEWKRMGEDFKSADWIYDSVDFLAQAQDMSALKALEPQVVDEGNTFLLQKIYRALGVHELGDHEKRQLLKCSEQAAALGKTRYAIKGFERLDMTDRAERLRATVATDGDIVAEAEAKVFIPPSEEEAELEESDA